MTSLDATNLSIPGRIDRCDLRVGAGEMVALIGPNGGGKTSLLRAIAGVEGSSGEVLVGGEALRGMGAARRSRLIGLVPASREARWPILVGDYMRLGLATVDEQRVAAMLDALELGPLVHRPIDQLSTGERARVAVARLLAARPALMLLDEPLANLEPYWVLRLLDLLGEAAVAGAALVVALHDLDQLGRFDRALLIADHRVQMDETPAKLLASERFATVFRVQPATRGFTYA